MLVYGLLLLYIIFISLIYKKINNKNKKIYLFFVFIGLFFVMGFRGKKVGTDTENYCYIFENIVKTPISELKDTPVVWIVINKIFGIFGTKPINYIMPLSFLILFGMAVFIYKNSEDIVMSLFLFILGFFYCTAFNAGRQYLSMTFCINTYKLFICDNIEKTKKIKIYIICNIIAILIHPVSIVFLITFPLLFIQPTKKNMLIYFVGTIMILGSFVSFAILLTKYFPHYELYVGTSGLTNYGFGVGKNRSVLINILYVILEGILLYTFNDNYIDKCDMKKHFCFIVINFINISLGFMSLKSIMFSRIQYYFSIFSIIFIPYILNKFIKKDRNVLKLGYLLIL